MTNTTEKMSNKEKSKARQLDILESIESFGYLSTKSIKELCYFDLKDSSATQNCKRILKKLEEEKKILKRESYDGINVFVITKRGCESIREKLKGIRAPKTGVDLATRDNVKQEVIVSELAKFKKQGFKVAGQAFKRYTKILGPLHAVAWKKSEQKYIGFFYVSNCRDETAENIIRFERQTKLISEIHLISNNDIYKERTISKKIKAIRITMPRPPVIL